MGYATLEQRREAREAVEGPGKFEGEPAITAILYGMALDSCADEEEGDSCDGPGYIWRIGRWMVEESPSGFVSSRRYDTLQAAVDAFQVFSDEYNGGEEEEEGPSTGSSCTHKPVAAGMASQVTGRIHVSASPLEVIRNARRAIGATQRRGGDAQLRAERHGYYRSALEAHKRNRDLFTAFRF